MHNEAKVIEKKLQSIYRTNYNKAKVCILLGSDGSTDCTDKVVKKWMDGHANVHFEAYSRQGKQQTLNKLYTKVLSLNPDKNSILIFSDANVLFKENTFYELAKHFKNTHIGLVGSRIINQLSLTNEISVQERFYIKKENELKYNEGKIWGKIMGAFGACYALRLACYKPIPYYLISDDFIVSIQCLLDGYKTIYEPLSLAIELTKDNIKSEFHRKTRIAIGNFQSLHYFGRSLWQWNVLHFMFFSHKFIRWIGPVLILISAISISILSIGFFSVFIPIFLYLFIILCVLIDFILIKRGKHFLFLRSVTYFIAMNIAFLKGMFMYYIGKSNHIWQPPDR